MNRRLWKIIITFLITVALFSYGPTFSLAAFYSTASTSSAFARTFFRTPVGGSDATSTSFSFGADGGKVRSD